MIKLETLAMYGFQDMGNLKCPRTLCCKGYSVFCSCSWDWNGVLSEHPRKSFWKSPISKGFPGPLWQLLF